MIEYRTKASESDEWGDWGPLSIPNQLVFSGWYNPRYMEFRDTQRHVYHHSQYPDEVRMHEEYCDYGALPHSGPCVQGQPVKVVVDLSALEKRISKLERMSHTHVAPMMPSS